jgi:hypothetical protein
MTVKNIIIDYLKKHKYDGLFATGEDDKCCCDLNNLIKCDNYKLCSSCSPGYKVQCDCRTSKCEFHIVNKRN